MKNGVLRAALVLCWVTLCSQVTFAQYTVQHQQPTVLDRTTTNALEFIVSGINQNDILEALLFYKNEGDLGYSQREISYLNGSFIALITPEDLTGSRFEYYFQLSLRDEVQDVFYPENLPAENPVEVNIVEGPAENEVPQLPQAEGIDYTVLSPRPGNGLAKNDVYIAVALFYDINEVEPGEFKLLLDGLDVTGLADTSDYFISYVPKNLRQGTHSVQLNYVTSTETYNVVSWQFAVVDPRRASYRGFEPRLIPTGRVELTARNQTISGDINNAFTGRSFINGSYGLFKYSANGFITSQESNRLQPQNRFGVKLSLGKWWEFEAGHVYPRLSKFTISGRRMYGINTSLHVLWDAINVQFLYGELSRKVTNLYTSVEVDTVIAGGVPQDTTYTLGYESSGRGTFARKIIGGRVGLGNPRKFQLGIQAMKVEDDTSSIFNVIDYTDLVSSNQFLGALTNEDQTKLSQNPDLLRVQGGSPRPKGNFVAGIDLGFRAADNKIRFKTETVASALNNDIYGGPLDSLRAADIGFEDLNQSDLDILTSLAQFIIINENMSVIPVRLKGLGTDSTEAEAFFPTSILGSDTELSIVHPKNNLSIQYRWVGPDFVSLANSTIRKDIAGFTISDRFRLFRNQLYVTLGYEALNDNVTDVKEATTKTNSYRSNVSWYPVRNSLPKISVGFRYRSRENGVERFNSEVPAELENSAVQNLRIVDGDTLTTTVPRMNTTLNLSFSVTQQVRFMDMVHDATVNVSSLNTTDEVFTYGDAKNSSVSLNIGSRFENLPLRTQLGMTFNNTESGNGQLDINIFGMYAGGTYFMMDGKLALNSRLAFTSNRSRTRTLSIENGEDSNFFNDYYVLSDERNSSNFGTYVLIAGAEYRLDNNHSFLFDSNFTNVSGANSINDRVVQLRYIYRF
ncbi:MAG: hypothetical protein JJ971_02605 [Balneolaceae bacterium]|nr:hypothetical protein [Balneolaceae bacterium]MBO6545262.1 hypothetical protein [Balneolaceae bacterium]MBO6646658.1 hypothetical protein [Balneolaceae bacterium]